MKDLIERHNLYTNSLHEIYNPYRTMDSEELWHFKRRLGIGGSDIGAILNLNPYKTASDVWEEKVNGKKDDHQSEAAYWGNALEDVVAKEFAKRNDLVIEQPDSHFSYNLAPWCQANLDRMIVNEFGFDVLECKCASAYSSEWGDEDSDKVPHSYYAQCQWYLMITRASCCYVALLQGGNKYRQFKIIPDKKIQKIMLDKSTKFWFENVIGKVKPAPESLKEINDHLKSDNGESVLVNRECYQAIKDLSRIKEHIKEIEKSKKNLELDIKKFMGDNAYAVDGSGCKLASWKKQDSRRFDTTAFKKDHPDLYEKYTKISESRVFKIR